MSVVFAPGAAVLTRLANRYKIPLVSAAYFAPFLVAIVPALPLLSPAGWALTAAGVALALYLIIGFIIQSDRGFRVCGNMIRSLSEGDLTVQGDLSMGGPIGEMIRILDSANGSLRQLISQVLGIAQSIPGTAQDLTAGHVNLSRRAEDQAASLEETAAGMEELASTVKQNAQNCEAASALSSKATALAAQGAQTVQRAVERMQFIQSGSQKVVDIITMIDDIAFRTNILALNAAVEAARAGDEGRGFAVVAAEVRALARHSADAAREIKVLVQKSVGDVDEGSKLVTDAGAIINDIVRSIHKADALFAEISAATREQGSGIGQVNSAITQLEGGTQQNLGLVEQTTAAMAAFGQEARRLTEATSRFRVQDRPMPGAPAADGKENFGLLAPSVALMFRLRMQVKYPFLLTVHLLPFAVAAYFGHEAWTSVTLGMVAAALLLAAYTMASHLVQARGDFRVLERLMQRVKEGDFATRTDTTAGGEIGEMIKGMTRVNGNLGQMISQVRASAQSISVTSGEISEGHADLSQRTEEQAASLEETAAGMEELASTVNQTAQNCRAASELAANAAAAAARGAQSVRHAVERMAQINDSAKRVAEIVGVIDDLAFQTNLLALHAAVEAARVGEQGHGFAVVAIDVRALAERSVEAATQIKALVQESVRDIAEGSKLVAGAGEIINAMVARSREVDQLFRQVDRASQEQSVAVAQISNAVSQLEGSTQQNVGLVEKTTAAMKDFQKEAQRLTGALERFSVLDTADLPAPVLPARASPGNRGAAPTHMPLRLADGAAGQMAQA